MKIPNVAGALLRLRAENPLIHCITSPIAINDCANALLAIGARPIMAEHPREAAEVTAVSSALSVSLANITDARAEAMIISGCEARRRGLPSVIDLVGVSCSAMRMELAREYIRRCAPAVVKGNASEIRAIAGLPFGNRGIDAAPEDCAPGLAAIVRELASSLGAVVLASGASDLISDGELCWTVENGCEAMSCVTGTGCVLSCVTAACLAVAAPGEAAVCAAGMMGVAGERADSGAGLGSYHMHLIDALSQLGGEDLMKSLQIRGADEK